MRKVAVIWIFLPIWLIALRPADHVSAITEAMQDGLQLPPGEPVMIDSLSEEDPEYWLQEGYIDTLYNYILIKGENYLSQGKTIPEAISLLHEYVSSRFSTEAYPIIPTTAFNAVAVFSETQGDDFSALQNEKTAYKYADLLPDDQAKTKGTRLYNMGVYSLRLGNYSSAKQYFRESLTWYDRVEDLAPVNYYFIYNSIATMNWYELKLDSAKYYYYKTLDVIDKMEPTTLNQYYRRAIVINGLAGVIINEGKSQEAIDLSYEAIENYQKFIKSESDPGRIHNATLSLYEVVDNLSAIYETIGNYKRAESLKLYSRKQKENTFGKDHPGVHISDILLGNHYKETKRFQLALERLKDGISGLKSLSSGYEFWLGDGYSFLADIYARKGETEEAITAFREADIYYELALGDDIDPAYPFFLRNKSFFLAEQNQYGEAINTIEKLGKYLKSLPDEPHLQYYLYYDFLARIHFISGQYHQAMENSDLAMTHIRKLFSSGDPEIDSIAIETYKPSPVLTKLKAVYALTPNRDSVFLKDINRRLEEIQMILEKEKSLVGDPENVNILMENHKELIDFMSHIALELKKNTGNPDYVKNFVQLRESILFSRIRSRINQQKAINFPDIPPDIILKEEHLKNVLENGFLQDFEENPAQIRTAIEEWDLFLEELKKEYPRYYQLKYATVSETELHFEKSEDPNSTMVRYYIVDTTLAILVANPDTMNLVTIPMTGIKEKIEDLNQLPDQDTSQLSLLHELYQLIWEPVQPYISTEKVMIIPDGVLYNINLEILPEIPVRSYKALSEEALLNRHIFTYHYSLWMLDFFTDHSESLKNYIAFVPGFSDDLKNQYLEQVSDSLFLDEDYLKLLPQPRSEKLVRKLRKKLRGSVYHGRHSTARAFRDKAGHHKIVHIATHAEFNNAFPEQSGMFFSKDGAEENFFTIKDIFEASIPSDITILTACESGRTGYQDGEGMVSLSLAFNYAGSNNLLTALSKIDETTSAEIVERFIDEIRQGKSTDEALHRSKLAYLSQAEGRLLAPSYWSSIVLIGEPRCIDLGRNTTSLLSWFIGSALLFGSGFWFFSVFRRRRPDVL